MQIAYISTSRADWGILESLYFATGGKILRLDTDKLKGKTESEIFLESFRFYDDALKDNIDTVVLLGDRYEVLGAAIAANMKKKKIIHLHGGENSGNYDNNFRYAITKLSHLHFPATSFAANILKKQGEHNVYYLGALGCYGLAPDPMRNEYTRSAICIYHPNTIENEDCEELLKAMKNTVYNYLVIGSNLDSGANVFTEKIKKELKSSNDFIYCDNLERHYYIEALRSAAFIIGNSSSGIIEAPAVGVPTINIGSRQHKRQKAESIIDCKMSQTEILLAIRLAEQMNHDDNKKILKQKLYYQCQKDTPQLMAKIIKNELPGISLLKEHL